MFILTKTDTCKQMQAALDDPNVAIFYAPAVREFTIGWAEPGDIPNETWRDLSEAGLSVPGGYVNFCPWTGAILPPSLYEEMRAYVLAENVIENFPEDISTPIDLPDEYRSEDWWRSRAEWPYPIVGAWPPLEMIAIRPPEGMNDWEPPVNIEDRRLPAFELNNQPWSPAQNPECPGLSRWLDRPAHHCQFCEPLWDWHGLLYAYLPHVREFGIRIIDPAKAVDYQPIKIVPVNYCHRCGTKLPPSVRPQWEARMRALGLDPTVPRTPFSDPLPDGLHGNGWWQEAQVYDPDWPHEFVPPFIPTPWGDDDDDDDEDGQQKQKVDALNDNKIIRPVD